eukprot:6327732-Amphidinium_carterae.1
MGKARNGVKILQLGAMRARGRHHAAADKHYPKVTAAIQEFISTHGPVPVRHIAWGDFSVALIRGKSSQFHVDPRNGLTFSACCSDGTAVTRLEYEGGCVSPIGRFWTEIKPMQVHKVVAFKERSSISVYLPPLRGYSSCDTGSQGPTQIILRCSDSVGETQHAWPHNASARFLLSQCLKQVGKYTVYDKVRLSMLHGKTLEMDDIIPVGSTVLAVLEQAQASLQMTAGGKHGTSQ